jgi:hypothetical protein
MTEEKKETLEKCPVCSSHNWTREKRKWYRCNYCGNLEKKYVHRLCLVCEKPIGKYAKENVKICLACKTEKNRPKIKNLFCLTPTCQNRLGKLADSTGYCRECQRERRLWTDGNLWKERAWEMLKVPTKYKKIISKMQELYPGLTEYPIKNWLRLHVKLGSITKPKRGTYVLGAKCDN